MVKGSGEYHIVMIFLPVLLYFSVMRLVSVAVVYIAEETGVAVSGTLRQLICMSVGLAVIYPLFYLREKKAYREWNDRELAVKAGGWPDPGGIVLSVLTFIPACCCGNAFVNVINLSGYSEGYGKVAETLYSGSLFLELTAYVLLSPLAEEILYRGIVFCRVRRVLGVVPGVITSALLFSIFHANLVQAAYSLFMGVLLGIFMEYYQNIYIVIIGHGAANLLSVLNTEFGFYDLEKMGYDMYLGIAFASFAAVLIIAVVMVTKLRKRLNIISK